MNRSAGSIGTSTRALFFLVLGLAACGARDSGPPRTVDLLDLVEAGRYAVGASAPGVPHFDHPPRRMAVTADHERRPAVVAPPGEWSWQGRIPAGARLQLGAALTGTGELEVAVTLDDGHRREVLTVGRAAERRWVDLGFDLGSWAGRTVTLEAEARAHGAAPGVEIAWGPAVLTAPAPEAAREAPAGAPPNVLFILIDTLRADHLSCYGYGRPTSPRIDALLAARGVLVEQAYSQAPWTLPSVVSLMTGRYPGDLLGAEPAAFAIPAEVEPMAEVFARRGYSTAGFNANPTLFAGNGFGRGFATFFSPPPSFDWFHRHAEDLTRRAVPWLAAHQDRPFFAYLHYLDPHDPYDNPDIVGGRSSFFPDYRGHLTGRDVHGVYAGAHPLEDPEADVAHLTALYDEEIRYADRFVGEVIESLRPETLRNTLILLTSDHGEELYDHGGWKHGQSLYQEQIRVPLVARWDGRLPAGERLAGSAELVDLLPTLAALAGAEPDPAWDGQDLLPALEGRAPLPRRAAFSQHMSAGPRRAAVVVDGTKLVLFDARAPFDPTDDLQTYLWQKDLGRFEGVELYHLGSDPGERRNLAAEDRGTVERLAPLLHHRLSGQLGGLRLAVTGLPAGSRLTARVVFDQAPEGWISYFLAPEDRVEIAGDALVLELRGVPRAPPGRGLELRGPPLGIEEIHLELDGAELPGEAARLGGGEPWAGGPAEAARLRGVPRLAEGTPGGPRLHLWWPAASGSRAEEENPETRERLKALGYLGG